MNNIVRFARVVILASVVVHLCESNLFGQAIAIAEPVSKRLELLEQAVRALERQVSDLTTTLRAALPPSPILDIQPFDLNIDNAATKGSRSATVALIEYSDFQCPFCGQHSKTAYRELQREFVDTGRIRYVFRNLPIESLHPLAFKAAEAGECAREQNKFWEMHDRLFSNQQALGISDLLDHAQALNVDFAIFRGCLTDGAMTAKVRDDLAEAGRLGLTATPVFLVGQFQGDGSVRIRRKITGAQPFQVFQAALEAFLPKPPGPTGK
jgi:protein-disulfide isomerase